jgi:hypothetical protein
MAGSPRCTSAAACPSPTPRDNCDYLHRRYGRFPATTGPFRTLLAYQAHHVDPDFYDRFYRPDALTPAHRQRDEA